MAAHPLGEVPHDREPTVVGLAGLGGAAPGVPAGEPLHGDGVTVGAAIAEDAHRTGVFHIKCKGLPRQLHRHGPRDEGDRLGGAVFGSIAVAAVDGAHGVGAQVPDGGTVGGDGIADAGQLGHDRRKIGQRPPGGGQDHDAAGDCLRDGLPGAGRDLPLMVQRVPSRSRATRRGEVVFDIKAPLVRFSFVRPLLQGEVALRSIDGEVV